MRRFEEGKIVPQQKCNGIVFANAEPGESGSGPAAPREQLALRTDALADYDGRGIFAHHFLPSAGLLPGLTSASI
jgi:hypothetical protein